VPELTLPVVGSGKVAVPAFGVADAEHRVEKEIAARLPEARLSVVSVRRPPDSSRIVEEFEVEYTLRLEITVHEADPDSARSAAFRAARERLEGTRYQRTVWDIAR
jgi:hypothetical protein